MVLERWAEKRRLRELEKVNQELERLKASPFASPSDKKDKTNRNTAPSHHSIKTIVLVILGFLFLIGLSIFYRMKAEQIGDDHQKTLDELEVMESQLEEVSESLDESEEQLRNRQKTEQNLSAQYQLLEQSLHEQEERVAQLEKDLATKDSQIANLTRDLRDRDEYIDNITDCIDDNDVTDKEDCIS